MNKSIYLVTVCLIFTLSALLISSAVLAKKRCKPFLEKLHKVQATQRRGYSLKRGESLRASEDKARDKWWQCENSSLAKFNAKYGNKKNKVKKNKKKTNKVAKSMNKKKLKNSRYSTKWQQAGYGTTKKNTTFNQGSAIVIKSKFQGDKHLAWLAYYNKPPKCQRPKSMSVFVFCNEDKRQQQTEFLQSYRQQVAKDDTAN